jgi:RNA polymerase sigma factor (sigma-70 family)
MTNTLTNEQLIATITTNPAARETLARQNMGLVHEIVKRVVPRHLRDDGVSEGMVGLAQAINTYSPDKQAMFSTYAHRCITNSVLSWLRADGTYRKHVPASINTPNAPQNSTYNDPEVEPPTRIETIISNTRLDVRSERIIRLRYGIGCERHTLEGVAAAVGLSIERVRQLENKALRALRVTVDNNL